MSRPVRCIVFDIDDTLYLERDYVRSGFVTAATVVEHERGVLGFAAVAQSLFEEGSRGDVFDRSLVRLGVEPAPDFVRRLVEAYRKHDPAIALLPDARQALEAASTVAAVAVVSDGPLASQRAKADRLGLSRWADPIVLTAERCPDRPKPHVHAFELVELARHVGRGECAYVADNPAKDFNGPLALGWRTVRVRRRHSLHAALDAPGVDVELPDLDELLPALGLVGPRPSSSFRPDGARGIGG